MRQVTSVKMGTYRKLVLWAARPGTVPCVLGVGGAYSWAARNCRWILELASDVAKERRLVKRCSASWTLAIAIWTETDRWRLLVHQQKTGGMALAHPCYG